jgi:23S rRNA (adenine2030-N6)-methyltransferase
MRARLPRDGAGTARYPLPTARDRDRDAAGRGKPMNYRHGFHAGNHTEILKHGALVAIVEALRQKPRPFFVLDTHAGPGLVDLSADSAARTGEAAAGIGRVWDRALPAAGVYLDIVRRFNPDGLARYPGSPAIVRELLREDDRLVACELHPDDVVPLRALMRGDRRVAIHHRDGYGALKAFLPPKEGRGLVLLDPPFEARDEFARLAEALAFTARRWPAGVLAGWYPVKDPDAVASFHMAIEAAAVPECLVAEVTLRPADGTLVGGGLAIVNPPYRLDGRLAALGAEILAAFGATEGASRVEWLTPPC